MKNVIKNHNNQTSINCLLEKEAIIEFQKLYKREYGILLSEQEAMEHGLKLIGLVKAVYGHKLPKNVDLSRNEANN